MSIHEDAAGNIWIGTFTGGLNRFDPAGETFAHFTTADGLPGDAVICIQSDDQGFLWLGTNTGLAKFDLAAETFQSFGPRDGLQDGEFISCTLAPDGWMYFGGLRGLNAFVPEQVEENRHLPPLAITALNVSGEKIRDNLAPGEHIELPYDQNFISFEYAALDYTDPQSSQYAYRLEGLEEDWVFAGTRRLASYPDLRPGDYVFHVKGANNDGLWNEEGAAVSVTITPPFWQTWPFRGAILLALLAAVLVGYRLRVRSLHARSRELEQQVEETTREVEARTREVAVLAERQRLARDLHDSVTQSLYSLTLMAGAAERLYQKGDIERAAEYQARQGQIAQEALKEMRLLVYELRPSALEEEGLVGALRQRLDAVERRVDIEATLDVGRRA